MSFPFILFLAVMAYVGTALVSAKIDDAKCIIKEPCPTDGETCKHKATLAPFGMDFYDHLKCDGGSLVVDFCQHDGDNLAETVCWKGAVVDNCKRQLKAVDDTAKAKRDDVLNVFSVDPEDPNQRTKLGRVACSTATGTDTTKERGVTFNVPEEVEKRKRKKKKRM